MSADRGRKVASPPDTPDVAVSLARIGWPVFPVTIYEDATGKRHKVPAVKWKAEATTDVDTVLRWWAGEHSGRWVGVYAGAAGIVVLDVDPGGDEAIAEAGHEIPKTFHYPTHRAGGEHHVYAAPEGIELTIAKALLPHVDVRSGAGLMVYYGPELTKKPKLAPAPDWILVPAGESRAGGEHGDRAPSADEDAFRARLVPGSPDKRVRRALATVKRTGMDHGDMLEAVTEIVKLGVTGHPGVGDALDRARAVYADGWPDAGRAWDNAVAGSVRRLGLPPMTFKLSKAERRTLAERHAEPATLPLTEGAAVLDETRAQIRRFVALPSEWHEAAVTLWAVHTHLVDRFDSTPRIVFASPEPGSGKTRALEVLARLANDPVETMNTTTAFLARRIDSGDVPPTILFDEFDTLFGARARDAQAEELRGIFNSGHRRGASYSRAATRGKEVVLEEFNTFAPVAMAGLGELPDTIRTRAVIVPMRRRARSEPVEPYRERQNGGELETTRDRIAAWARTAKHSIGNPWPEMPDGITDRDADVWEPLLAVADAAGGFWPKLARDAALVIVRDAHDRPASLGLRLLADVRRVFDRVGETRIRSTELLHELLGLDEAPWSDLGGKGAIESRYLGRTFDAYGIPAARPIRFGGLGVQKGWARSDFADAWTRYLPDLESTTLPLETTEHNTKGKKS